jgi:prepilin-type N-terminal cleavage/methylation domain-containing protein
MKSTQRAGFTLVELMIAIAIIGVLAALAIPTFRTFVLRSKTVEATAHLGTMFKGAAAYYSVERGEMGQTGALLTGCTVGDISPKPANPGPQKQRLPFDPGLRAISFSVSEYIYYSYGLNSETSTDVCGGTANDATVYTLYANGDLDGDTTLSQFEMAVGSDGNNELYHARGMYVTDELE